MLQPFRVSALGDGTVGLTSKAVLACPMLSGVEQWLADVVQPAAALYYGAPVAELRAGSYSCRGVNNRMGGPKSEHAFGNAMDVMGFRLADGREISVEKGWRGQRTEQEFLREVFVGSCRHFTTVLAPGSDAMHYNHLHIDLARHSKGRVICKPVIKFEPRLDARGRATGYAEAASAADAVSLGSARQPDDARPALGRELRERRRARDGRAGAACRPARLRPVRTTSAGDGRDDREPDCGSQVMRPAWPCRRTRRLSA